MKRRAEFKQRKGIWVRVDGFVCFVCTFLSGDEVLNIVPRKTEENAYGFGTYHLN